MSKKDQKSVGVRSSPPKSKGNIRQPSVSQQRFRKALARSLAVRSRVLGRRLTKPEFASLSAAVKKQIKQETTPVNRRLNRVIDAVVRLEKSSKFSSPSLDRYSLECEITNLYDRLNLVRSTLLNAMEESSRLSEGCSHVAKKSTVHFSKPFKIAQFVKGFGCIYVDMPAGRQVLCCPRCSGQRNDAFFEWSGLQLSFKDREAHSTLEVIPHVKALEGVNPLDLQSVWTSVLDIHYDR